MPITSLSRRALFSAGVSVHLLSPPGVAACDGAFAPFPVLNFRAFSLVGSTRADQSLFDGGTIIHSSLWLLLGTCGRVSDDACAGLSRDPAVDASTPGRLGPKSSPSLVVLSESLSGPFAGRPSM